jgi:hypothetical protein
MTNTITLLKMIAGFIIGFTVVSGWAWLTLRLSDFAWWGVALYLAPLLVVPLALAIRADLKAKATPHPRNEA